MSNLFLEFSVAVTGFSRVDLLGTGVVDQYWDIVSKQEGSSELLEIWREIQDLPLDEQEAQLRDRVFGVDLFGDLARNIVKMWYTGQWANDTIVSGEAYQQGLVWTAINAHPQGAKQPGFGTWSFPLHYINDEVGS